MEPITEQQLEQYKEPVYQKMKYGAPELIKLYKKFAVGGLIFAFLLHGLMIGAYAFSLFMEQLDKERTQQIDRKVMLKDIQSNQKEDDQNTPPPEIEKIEEVKMIKDLASLNPEPVAKGKEEVEKLKSVEDQLKQDNTLRGKEDKEGADVPVDKLDKGKIDQVEKKEQNEEKKEVKKDVDKVYKQFEVDKAPVALNLGSVQGSMRYPEIAKQSNTEGRVTVQVLVGPDGSVISVGSMSGPDVFKDEVSSKVMNLRFSPAMQQGSPVKCWVTVPFSFTLKTGFKKENQDDTKKEEPKKEEKKEDNK